VSVEKYISNFIRFLKQERGYSINTLEAYRRDVNQFVEFYKEYSNEIPINLTKINRVGIRHFFGMLAENGLRNTTISRKLAAIKAFFKYLISQEILSSSPATLIKPPKSEKHLPTVLSEKEIRKVFEIPDADTFIGRRNRTILELFYSAGIRLGELIALNIRDINFSKNLVKVFGKGAKERIVPFSQKVKDTLEIYLKTRREDYGDITLNSPLFISIRGKRISRQMVQVIVKKVLEQVSEQEHLSPHAIRHTFASHLLDKGADLNAVKDLLGHSSLSTTQLYTHIQIGKIKEAYKLAHPHAK